MDRGWDVTGSKLFPLVSNETTKPLGNAVGTTLSHVWQMLIGDRVVSWRLRNAAGINDALGRHLAKTGQTLNLDKVPEGFAYSWFQKATESEEPELQELFAKLLANAANGNQEALKKRNIDLVSRLTPGDAILLTHLAEGQDFNIIERLRRTKRIRVRASHTLIRQAINEGADAESFDVLLSLGILDVVKAVSVNSASTKSLIRRVVTEKLTSRSNFDSMIQTSESFILTALGASLIEAVFPNEPGARPHAKV